MGDYSTTHPLRRTLYLGLLGVFLFSIVLRAALTVNRELDIDEFQHLHAAWMVSQHCAIYKEFWANHTPLFYYLLLPLFRFCREGSRLVLTVRMIMSLSGLGILVLTYALSRIAHDRLTSSLAVILLSYMVIFAEKSIEVRPDQILVILWLASLWISIRTFLSEWRFGFILAGFLLGMAFLFSPKALLPYAAMSFAFLTQSYIRRSQRGFRRFLRIQSGYTLGFLTPIAMCLALFYYAGSLKEMLAQTVLENLTYPNIYRPFYLLNLSHICFFLLALAGAIIHLRDLRRHSAAARANHLLLLTPALFLLLVFLFLQTAPYPQSVLLFASLFAIYGAEAFRKSFDGIQASRSLEGTRAKWLRSRAKHVLAFTAVLVAGLVIPCSMLLLKARPLSRTNAEQFARMEYVLDHTQPNDVVFDGESAYIFRPQAYFYGSLFHAVVWRMQRGEIKQDISESLKTTNCRVVIYDERVSTLPQPVQSFLRANYAPSAFPRVYFVRSR
jgi:hypothetical protein